MAVECRYRDKLIGFLIGDRYLKHEVALGGNGRRIRRNWPDGSYQIEKPNGKIVLKVKRHD